MKPRSLGFSPGRLTLALDLLGWTQRELADHAGLTAAAITNYVSGARQPDAQTLSTLATLLGQPVSFFLKDEPPALDAPMHYRSRRSAERLARVRAEAHMRALWEIVDYLQGFAHLPPVTLPPVGQMPRNPFNITTSMIHSAARIARDHWKLGDQPASNIVWLLEASGVVITRVDLSTEKLDALSTWRRSENRPYVILNSTKANAFRARADIAHELGHLLLHREIDDIDLNNTGIFALMEEQAWEFAQAFLLPGESFLREVHTLSLDGLLGLKPRWRVSVAFMLQRLRALDILTPEKFINYRKYLAGRRWLYTEPFDAETEPERPLMLQELITFLSQQELQTAEQILNGSALSGELLETLALTKRGHFTALRPANIPFTPKQRVI